MEKTFINISNADLNGNKFKVEIDGSNKINISILDASSSILGSFQVADTEISNVQNMLMAALAEKRLI